MQNYAANLSINGDMGWINSNTRRKIKMLRLWNNLFDMDDNILKKKIFLWGHNMNTKHLSAMKLALYSLASVEK